MTQAELDQLNRTAQALGLATPNQLSDSGSAPTLPAISGATGASLDELRSGAQASRALGASTAGAQGLTTPGGLTPGRALAPTTSLVDVSRRSDLEDAITSSMQMHREQAAKQQANLDEALASVRDLDKTDDERNAYASTIANTPSRINPWTGKNEVINAAPTISLEAIKATYPGISDNDAQAIKPQLERDTFVSNISPRPTGLEDYTNLQAGPSWRALESLGVQFPGSTSRYATAPVFQPSAPGPAQKVMAAQPVPGKTTDAQGNVVRQPASNIGLTTVRGTEFGEVDNPARGGYTEAGWNHGAWGANIASKTEPMVALPYAVLNKYGNPGDRNFGSDFNSKYEVQVIDTNTGKAITASLGDAGPGARTGAGIDMTWATREGLGLPVNYSGNISYRVVPKGSALPDNTTASTQQPPTQTAAAGAVSSDGLTQGPDAFTHYFVPVDKTKIRDPSVAGPRMGNQELMDWARSQANDYVTSLAQNNIPVTVEQYRDIFAKYAESAQKFHEAKEPYHELGADYGDQFSSLSTLVSPTGAVDMQGKPTDQLSLTYQLWEKAREEQIAGRGMPFNPEIEAYNAQKGHLVLPTARGLFSMKGAGNQAELEQAADAFPKLTDTPDVAKWKLDMIRQSVQDQQRRIIGMGRNQYMNVDQLEAEYRRNFVKTRAQNQQQWSKINAKTGGTPAQNQTVQQTNQAAQNQNPFQTSSNQFVGQNLYNRDFSAPTD